MMKKEKKDHPLCIITGTVVHGRGIGKFTGTPTANLAPALETVLPENGVYISKILLDTQTYYGATHIGTRPTVDGNPDISVETILLDFHREIYGCKIELQLYHKLRPVKEYSTFSLLHRQIQKDCAAVRQFWGIPSASSKPGEELKINARVENKRSIPHGIRKRAGSISVSKRIPGTESAPRQSGCSLYKRTDL